MTREEAWKRAKGYLYDALDWEEADEIIRTLEQELCEDLISRKSVLSKIKEVCFSKEWAQFRIDYGSHGQRDFLINYIKQLSSVTPHYTNTKIQKI